MYKGIRTLKNFELFCNPNNLVLSNYYDYISYDCLEYSSYIHYIVIDILNGEINSRPYNVLNLDEIKNCLLKGSYVIAFNHLDYSILEVKL